MLVVHVFIDKSCAMLSHRPADGSSSSTVEVWKNQSRKSFVIIFETWNSDKKSSLLLSFLCSSSAPCCQQELWKLVSLRSSKQQAWQTYSLQQWKLSHHRPSWSWRFKIKKEIFHSKFTGEEVNLTFRKSSIDCENVGKMWTRKKLVSSSENADFQSLHSRILLISNE